MARFEVLGRGAATSRDSGRTSLKKGPAYLMSMGDRYAWLKVEGDWGIRLGNENTKLEVWDYGEDGTRTS